MMHLCIMLGGLIHSQWVGIAGTALVHHDKKLTGTFRHHAILYGLILKCVADIDGTITDDFGTAIYYRPVPIYNIVLYILSIWELQGKVM